MKPMIYQDKKKGKTILQQGEYLGIKYLILSLNTHPTAYIIIDKNTQLYNKDYDEIHELIDIEVHGGLTFADNVLHNIIEYSEKYKCDTLQKYEYDWIIGWDYAHFGDYTTFCPQGKKYTTQEIQYDVYRAIEQIHNQVIHSLIKLSRKQFVDKIIEEINETCGYDGYVPTFDDKEDIIDFAFSIPVEECTLEELDDARFEQYCDYLDIATVGEIQDYAEECRHPYDPFREHCDADFYGI